jgi:hypothetical protein
MVNRKAESQIGNLTFDHKKLRIEPISLRAGDMQHAIEKLSMKATTLLQTSSQSKVCIRSYSLAKLREFQLWRDKKPFG